MAKQLEKESDKKFKLRQRFLDQMKQNKMKNDLRKPAANKILEDNSQRITQYRCAGFGNYNDIRNPSVPVNFSSFQSSNTAGAGDLHNKRSHIGIRALHTHQQVFDSTAYQDERCIQDRPLASQTKSMSSSKTYRIKSSAESLRQKVKSQCKLYNQINETIRKLDCTDKATPSRSEQKDKPAKPDDILCDICSKPCKVLSDEELPKCSKKKTKSDKVTQTADDNEADEIKTISIEGVIHEKYVYPLIRKVQKMYCRTLVDKVALMDDLEALPYKIKDIFMQPDFSKNLQ